MGVYAKYSLSPLNKLTFSSVCLKNSLQLLPRLHLALSRAAWVVVFGQDFTYMVCVCFETTDLPQTWQWCVWEPEHCWAGSTDLAWREAAVSWCSWAWAPCPGGTLSKNNHRFIAVKCAWYTDRLLLRITHLRNTQDSVEWDQQSLVLWKSMLQYIAPMTLK